MSHPYVYLTQGGTPDKPAALTSRLSEELSKAQKKAPPAQWMAFIEGLTKKGVKGTEIEELEILGWLQEQADSGATSISRTELVAALSKKIPIIKEVELSQPRYASYRHHGDTKYSETLYIWNSEKDCYKDRLADIRFEIEELDFNPMLLVEDPERALRLYEEQQKLLSKSKVAKGHKFHHYTNVKDPHTGETVCNLIAHSRVSEFNDLFFVQEIQSDWAQQGRKDNWTRTPKGPFVTNTELWSGLVLRRLMQQAAKASHIKRFAWIVGNMRNGGRFVRDDNLDNFYLKILPKIADRALSGTGEKTKLIKVALGDREYEVPGFEITDKVREKLSMSQPLYSRDISSERSMPTTESDPAFKQALQEAHEMLGDSVSINLAARVLDAATGQEVAGRQIGHLIEISAQARNPALAVPHEAWHYAAEHLIGPMDRQTVESAFAPGTKLNNKVRMALVKDGALPQTVAQCDEAHEAAAHGFALWTQGKLQITTQSEREAEYAGEHLVDRTVGKVFRKVEQAFMSLSQWIKRKVGETEQSANTRRVEDIFKALRSGSLAKPNDAHNDVAHEQSHEEAPALRVVRVRQRA